MKVTALSDAKIVEDTAKAGAEDMEDDEYEE